MQWHGPLDAELLIKGDWMNISDGCYIEGSIKGNLKGSLSKAGKHPKHGIPLFIKGTTGQITARLTRRVGHRK